MIKVRVFIRTEEYYDPNFAFRERSVHVEGELVNVFWHPIEGEMAAVVTEYGEIETFKLEHITVTEESA